MLYRNFFNKSNTFFISFNSLHKSILIIFSIFYVFQSVCNRDSDPSPAFSKPDRVRPVENNRWFCFEFETKAGCRMSRSPSEGGGPDPGSKHQRFFFFVFLCFEIGFELLAINAQTNTLSLVFFDFVMVFLHFVIFGRHPKMCVLFCCVVDITHGW